MFFHDIIVIPFDCQRCQLLQLPHLQVKQSLGFSMCNPEDLLYKYYHYLQPPHGYISQVRLTIDQFGRKAVKSSDPMIIQCSIFIVWFGGHKEMSSILADQQHPRIWAQMRGGGEFGGSQPMSTDVHKAYEAQINFEDLTTFNLWFDWFMTGPSLPYLIMVAYLWPLNNL